MSGQTLRVLLGLCILVQTVFCSSILPNGYVRRGRQTCRTNEFVCRNGACIDGTRICDGAVDCPDGSDETSQVCLNTIICPSYAFRCDYGGCVDADSRCNKKVDCADGSDERGCPGSSVTTASNCKSAQFQCKSGQCIDSLLQCDGAKDCNDGSDETWESCGSFSCPGFAFRCAYGGCIDGDERCNGVAQCADGSDESPRICGPAATPTTTTTTTTTSPPPVKELCILPKKPVNGQYVIGGCENNNCPPPGTGLQYAYLTYTCNPGYDITGAQTVFCQEGTWFNQPPTCTKVSCSPLVSTSREITCKHKQDEVPCTERMPVGTVATIQCKEHYQSVAGLSTYLSECKSDGTWSAALTQCFPVCGKRNPSGVPFISNGVKSKFGEFPWHVGVYRMIDGGEVQICGGTLISSRTVISAAHCFYDEDNDKPIDKSEFKVAAGKYFREWEKKNKYLQEVEIENIVLPEMYKGKFLSYESDIAVVNFKVEIEFNVAIRPVCLDRDHKYENFFLSDGNLGAVVGWGVDESMEPSTELNTAYLPYVDFKKCYDSVPETFRQFLRQDKFCAGYHNGTSVCPGDSGGGLSFPQTTELGTHWYLQGIVSVGVPPKGADKCFTREYSAFTKVAKYYNFIDKNMIR